MADDDAIRGHPKPTAVRLQAIGWIRALDPNGEAGGSQAHVFDTHAGPYMVKAKNNKQHLRVLVNELVGGLCLDWLKVQHPPPAIVDIPQEVINDNPGARYSDGTPVAAGAAFGSAFWQSDAMGSVSASSLANGADIGGTQAADAWMGQYDARQYRVRASSSVGKYDFIPVDQGHGIGRPNWDNTSLEGSPPVSIGPSPIVLSRTHVEPAIEQLRNFDSDVADHIVQQIPTEWDVSDADREALIRYLLRRATEAADALDLTYPKGGGTDDC